VVRDLLELALRNGGALALRAGDNATQAFANVIGFDQVTGGQDRSLVQ
jgi:hypothetical protein